jgi:S-formylglutathione hydrolase FrmB
MITGFSMGGYGAMNIALHHPELYSAVASIAGYFDTDDESGIFAGDKSLLATNSPDHHVQTALQLRVMLADGADDTEPVVRGETQRFAALLRSAGASPYVDIRPGEHTLDYLRAELPRVLEFLVAGKQ